MTRSEGVNNRGQQLHFLLTLKFCENDVKEMAKVLGSDQLGYDVANLVGQVNSEEMRDAINNFFRKDVSSKDTLLFYFSGHGVLNSSGDNYLASSETDLDGGKGVWFNELDNLIEKYISRRKVIVLDCCYAGALGSIGIKKGSEENAKKGAAAIRNKIRSGTGKCILSACLDTQEAESTAKRDLSIFTHFLLEGLKGLEEGYVDRDGNVTTNLLGQYVFDKITSLPKKEKPKQIPIIKTEQSGEIILATYPEKIRAERRGISEKVLLELLKQGIIRDFNKMRERDQSVVPNLHVAYLKRANLRRANLRDVNLKTANLEGADLEGADLTRAVASPLMYI